MIQRQYDPIEGSVTLCYNIEHLQRKTRTREQLVIPRKRKQKQLPELCMVKFPNSWNYQLLLRAFVLYISFLLEQKRVLMNGVMHCAGHI